MQGCCKMHTLGRRWRSTCSGGSAAKGARQSCSTCRTPSVPTSTPGCSNRCPCGFWTHGWSHLSLVQFDPSFRAASVKWACTVS